MVGTAENAAGIEAIIGENACREGQLDIHFLMLAVAAGAQEAEIARAVAAERAREAGPPAVDADADGVDPDPGTNGPSDLELRCRAGDGRLFWHWDPRFLEGRERDFADVLALKRRPASKALTTTSGRALLLKALPDSKINWLVPTLTSAGPCMT